MMTYSEFRKKVIKMLKERINDNEYINALNDDIKEYYDDIREAEKILGEDQLSVDDYVIGILFMYPELP